jgi:hypothetical protein
MIRLMLVGLLIALLSFAISCKRDPPLLPSPPTKFTVIETEPEACSLVDSSIFFPQCNSLIGVNVTSLFPVVMDANYNPKNTSNIVFYKRNNLNAPSIVIYNTQSKISQTIATNVNIIGSNLVWARNGNIYYNGNNRQIQSYDPLQSKILQLNLMKGDTHLRIEDTLIYSINGDLELGLFYFKNTLKGKRLDSIHAPLNYCFDLSKIGELAFADTSLYSYNLGLLRYEGIKRYMSKLTNFTDLDYITYIKWHPDAENVYFIKNKLVLYKVNVRTKKLQLVKKFLNDRLVLSFDISPEGKKILLCFAVGRVKKLNPIDPCEQEQYWQISEMDINGCNEKIVYREVN